MTERKHIFIINPHAGSGSCAQSVTDRVGAAFGDCPELCELYLTQRAGDATDYARRRCESAVEGEQLCFYACGGDGTLHEVVCGIAPFPFARLGVVPCGTGNDFVKNFPQCDFNDLTAQRRGEEATADLLECNGRLTANICNAGLDADVARDIVLFKRLPLMGGPMAYLLSLCKNFFGKLGQHATITVDGGLPYSCELLLLVIANGRYYGGSFCGAPEASTSDGLLDLSIVPKLGHCKILSVLPRYQKGRHTTDPDLIKLVQYCKCSALTVDYDKPVSICLDGETSQTQRIEAKILPGALRLWLPACKTAVPDSIASAH
ncbi:MAG: diacylglycerol kinase family protein [Angelakisella sp.]